MFLRFTSHEIDLRTGRHKGIFTLAYDLLKSNTLLNHEEDYLRILLKWFDKNLPKPTKFSKNKNSSHKENISTAWFKDSATELISKIREIQHILETHEIIVEVKLSKKPGYIIYEDNFQIVVDPF
jgi:hypothetical protein